MKSLFNEKVKRLFGHRVIPYIITVRKCLMLICNVFCVSETTQVPARVLDTWELPTAVPKSVRPDSLEELCSRDDCPEPGLARK